MAGGLISLSWKRTANFAPTSRELAATWEASKKPFSAMLRGWLTEAMNLVSELVFATDVSPYSANRAMRKRIGFLPLDLEEPEDLEVLVFLDVLEFLEPFVFLVDLVFIVFLEGLRTMPTSAESCALSMFVGQE